MGLFDDVLGDSAAGAGGGLFDDVMEAPKKQNKGIGGDLATDIKRGVLGLPVAVTGLLDIPVAAVTGNPMVSKGWEGIGDITGFKPGQWAKDAEAEYSPARQEANQQKDAAWETGAAADIAGAYLKNPLHNIVGPIAESVPSMLAGGLAGRAALGIGAKGVSTAAGAVGPAIPGAIARTVGEKMAPAVAAGIGEGAIVGGQAMANLVDAGVDPRTAAGYASATGLAVGGIGTMGGQVAKRFGLADPDTALVAGMPGRVDTGATGMAAAKEIGKRMAGGGIAEGVFEELPQSVVEQGLANLAQDKPVTEGMARAGVEGALAGFGMGAAFNALPGAKYAESKRTPPAEDKPEIAGLLPAPTYTGTPSDQMLQAEAERQAAIDAADANAAAVYAARDAFEQQLRQAVTIINEPAPLQQRIDELLNVDTAPMTKAERAKYEKALTAAFGEPIGIRHDENQREVPFTMGEYLDAQLAAENAARARPLKQNAAQQADARMQQLADEETPTAALPAPAIPVVGPLSAVANMAVQSGLTAQVQGQQAAAQAPMTAAANAAASNIQPSPPNIAAQAPNIEGNANAPQFAQVAQEAPQANAAQAGAQSIAAPAAGQGQGGGSGQAIDLSNRTDAQLNFLSLRGINGHKEAAIAEISKRAGVVAAIAEQSSPVAPSAAPVAPADDPIGWTRMTTVEREALVARAGWAGKNRGMNLPGSRVAAQAWDAMTEANRAKLTAAHDARFNPSNPATSGDLTYEQFKAEMQKLFRSGLKYKPSQVGFNDYSAKMADLSDKHPEYSARLDAESDQEPIKNEAPSAASVPDETAGENQEPIKKEDQPGAETVMAPANAEASNPADVTKDFAYIRPYRRPGSDSLLYEAVKFTANIETGKTLESKKSTERSEDAAINFIKSQGYDGAIDVHSKTMRDGNKSSGSIDLIGVERIGNEIVVKHKVYDSAKEKRFASVSEMIGYLDASLFDWPQRKAEIIGGVGETPKEDDIYRLGAMDVFSLKKEARSLGIDFGKTGKKANIINDILANRHGMQKTDTAPAIAPQHIENGEAEPATAAVVAANQLPIKNEAPSAASVPAETAGQNQEPIKKTSATGPLRITENADLGQFTARTTDGSSMGSFQIKNGQVTNIKARAQWAMDDVRTAAEEFAKNQPDDRPYLFKELRSKLDGLAERAMNAGDGAMSGRFRGFTVGMKEDDSNLTRQWVDEVVGEREKMVARMERRNGSSQSANSEPAVDSDTRFAKNTIFTADKVAAAKARMKAKLGTMNSGIDPELLIDGMTVAGAYIESGVRKFSDYARAMVADLGDGVKPYLLSFYEAARAYPGLDKQGMDSAEAAARQHQALLTPEVKAAAKAVIGESPKVEKKKPANLGEAVRLKADWGVPSIDGYTRSKTGANQETDYGLKGGVKDEFLADATRYLKAVAKLLEAQGFTAHLDNRGKPAKTISANEDGPAVSGEVSLLMRRGNFGLYAQVGTSAVRGIGPAHPQGVSLIVRTTGDVAKHRYGEMNHWLPLDLSAGDLAGWFEKRLDIANASPAPTMEAKDTNGVKNANALQPEELPGAVAGATQGDVGYGNRDRQPLASGLAADGQGSDRQRGVSGRPERTGSAGNQGQTGRQPEPSVELGKERGNGADGRAADADDHVVDAGDIGKGGLTKKYSDNIAAIKIIKAMEAEGRVATPEERKQIARYAGWGALKGVFDPANKGWAKQHEELKALLTDAEFAAARKSTLNAHYTSPVAVGAMYDALERLGFTGGRVLEPSVGVGNFFGLMPAKMRNASNLHGVELDALTSRLVVALYPKAKIAQATGFQDFEIPAEFFDAVVGNPPFGSEPIVDMNRSPYSGFSIHNYFLAKSIDKLRPGGIMQVVVSHSFLDAQDDRARQWIGERANLIGGVRLPNTAFKENAGTVVVTDILIFQKKSDAERVNGLNNDLAPWLKAVDQQNTNPKTGETATHKVNQFFASQPQLVLGQPSAAGSMYRANEYTVEATGDIKSKLDAWVQTLPEKIFTPIDRRSDRQIVDMAIPDGIKTGSFYVDQTGAVMRRGDDVMGNKTAEPFVPKSLAATARVKGMIGLRDLLRQQMRLERSADATEAGIEANRAKLNTAYDDFLKKFGHVNSVTNRNVFMDDTESQLVQALEFDFDKGISAATAEREGIEAKAPSAKKADIFQRRVMFPPSDFMKVTSAKDALLASLNYRGKVDLSYMGEVYAKSPAEIVKELGDVLFDDPQAGIVMADEYLSGDVKTKLAEAQGAALTDGRYQRNVEALTKIIPEDKKPSEISVSIGAAFIPAETYAAFIQHITGGGAKLAYLKSTGQWLVEYVGSPDMTLNAGTFGTSHLSARDLFSLSMLGRGAVVRETRRNNPDGSTTTVVLEKETEAAREKQNAIKNEWQKWLWNDAGRADQIAAIYNDKMNRIVERQFDGEHMTFPGMNPAITLLEHQKNGVWRGLQSYQVLYDHVVGAGKTFEMATLAMEMRRLGIARKPLFVVPNHLTLQWRNEFTRLYPGSNILAATPEDFSKDNRGRMFSKIVTGDWDAVILGHSSLKKVGLPEATERAVLEEQIKEIADAIEDMKRGRGDRNIIRDMEGIKARLEAKMKDKLAAIGKRDKVLTFDELGVDALFIDEMHEFKNLSYNSTMDRNPGMGNPAGSAKAFDLFVKTRWLFDTFGDKTPYITATGTPVSNSLVEMFNMQRYMQYPTLKREGLHVFDAWAKQFGSVENVYEVAPSGSGFRQSTRFAKFTNLPALMSLYNSFADTITLDDLKAQEEAQGKRFPVPKMVGGKPTLVVAQRSPLVAERMGVPRAVLNEAGEVTFVADLDQPVDIAKNDAGKWSAKVGENHLGNFETEEEARLRVVEKALAPNVAVAPESILGRFANLKQLTKETKGKVNALSLTGEANKAGLDYRLIDPSAPDFAGSKINLAVDNILRIHQQWRKDKGAQLVFCDMSIPLSARSNFGSKERRLYVRGDDGALAMKRGTLHAADGFESLPFFIIAKGDKAAKRFEVYDAATGFMVGGNFATRSEAKDRSVSLVESEAGRQRWLDKREGVAEITQEMIDEYNNDNGVETDGIDAFGPEDIAGMSGSAKFSVYDDIKAKLIAKGIPEREIAFIHDYATPVAKAKLFKSVNDGDVRVLIGSTQKMGAGTNVQERLVGLHHIDAPWRPSDLEQREGRIIRRGNALYERDPDGFEVFIGRYATEQTYDTRRWQILEHKARGIEQLRNFDGTTNEIEDIDGEAANAADMKAAASGDPLILEETKLRNEVKRLERLQDGHADEKLAMERKAKFQQTYAEDSGPAELKMIRGLMAEAAKYPADKKGFAPVTISGEKFTDVETATKEIGSTFNAVRGGFPVATVTFRGQRFTFSKPYGETVKVETDLGTLGLWSPTEAFSASGFVQRMINHVDRLAGHESSIVASIAKAKDDSVKLREQAKQPFQQEQDLEVARAEHGQVRRALMAKGPAVPADQKAMVDAAIEAQKDKLKALGFGKAVEEMFASGNISSSGRISPADKAIYGMAAEGKSAADILKFIAGNSRNLFYRQLAKLLLKTGINPSITVGDGKNWKFNAGEGNKYAAGYNPKTNTVALFRPAAAERNALHELVHAASLKALSGRGLAAAQMSALYQHVKKTGKLKGMYGMSDVDEFIAEAFSNPQFQQRLKAIPSAPVGGKSSSAWNWFVRIVRGILGIPHGQENALSQALEIGVDVMRENMRLNGDPKNDSVRGTADKDNVAGTQAPTSAGDGSTGSAKAPHVAAAEQMLSLMDDPVYTYGIRVLPDDFTDQVNVGESLPSSFVWEDGEITDDEIDGISTAGIRRADIDSVLAAMKNLGVTGKNGPNGYYFGSRVVLVRGDSNGSGQDVGETIIRDPEVLGEWKKPTNGLSEVVPNEPSASAGSDAIRYATGPKQTDSAAFRKWFGSSKVVDANGDPLVMYHGTSKDSDFSKFKVGARGAWFASSVEVANEYAEQNDSQADKYNPDTRRYEKVNYSGRVMPVYVKIEKPYKLTSEDRFKLNTGNYAKAQRDLFARVKAEGYDGIQWNDALNKEWVVLGGPEQIKSAIGNAGQFDANNPDIRYNVADEGWSVAEPSKMDDVIYALQDKQIDMKRVVQSIMRTGKQIKDNFNAYLQEELFHGRAAKGVKDFLDFELRPLLAEMQKAGVDMGDFEEYLWNRHAEERNQQIGKINPDMPDGGSGIKTADARAYLAGLDAGRRATMERLAAKVRAINASSQGILVSSGLEKQSTIDAWNGAYQHYVPLQREDVDTGHVGTGKGFSVRGSSTKRAMGSGRQVVDIIANLTMQRERNIVRAEKNRVSNALLGLAVQNPNPDFWQVDQAPKERIVENKAIYTVLDAAGEKIEEFTRMADAERLANKTDGATIDQTWGDRVSERVTPGFSTRDNVLLTRLNGEDHYVVFNERDERAMRMATAMKNLDVDTLGRVLSIVGKATRYLASVNTQYNPVFGVINLIRDAQGALINLSSTPLAGEQKRVLGYTKDALVGIYKDIRAHRAGKVPSSNWAALFEEFQKEGGQTGYRDQYANAEQRAEAIQSELKQFKEGKAKQFTRGIFGWLSDYNETMENAVRLAAYKAGKEKGMSNQQAASLAKNITVNFNRKGQMATQVGALYAFFNASVQGTARIAQTLFEQEGGNTKSIRLSKTGKKILAGGIMLGSMQALLLAAAGFDDDEPPEFVRERNLILPIGDGKYLTLAMPLGFHVIPGIGRIATEFVLSGGKDPLKKVAAFASMFAESFNPIGSSGFGLQTITPSVVDPFAALAENRDFTGKEIYREDFNKLAPTPGHARAKDVATIWSRYIAEATNFITGGSEFRPGLVNWSPDAIDYLIGQATGGAGREVSKAFQTGSAVTTGEDIPLYKIPLVGRFVGDTEGQSGQSAKFYDAIKQINMHEAEYKGLVKAGRREEATAYMAENPAVKLIMAGNHVERTVRKLRTMKRDLVEKDAGSDQIRAIDERITETMRAFNERAEAAI